MSKVAPAIRGFNAGLLSDSLSGRDDLKDIYPFGCLTFDNFMPEPEGPAVKRPGSEFIAPPKYSDKEFRLIDFAFSNATPYTLEFGDLYMRVFRTKQSVLDATAIATINGIDSTNPVVVHHSGIVFTAGDTVYIDGTDVGELNGQYFTVMNPMATAFEIDIDGTTITPQLGVAGSASKVYEIVSPYSEAELKTLFVFPSEDVLYIVCPTQVPRKLIRFDDDNWAFSEIWTTANLENTSDERLGLWPPFEEDQLLGDITIALSSSPAAGSSVTLTAAGGNLFEASDVGRYISKDSDQGSRGFGYITAYASPTSVTLYVLSNFGSDGATPSKAWAWGAFDEKNGFPTSVTVFENSLYYGGTTSLQKAWWKSSSGAYDNFRRYDDDGSGGWQVDPGSSIFYNIGGKGNRIEWMTGQDTLFAGTRGAEFTIEGANIEQGIEPGNIFVRERSSYGSRSNVAPITVGNVILFPQRSGRKLKELVYRVDQDKFAAPEMTRLSRDALRGRLKYMEYQQEPNRVVWCVMEDGTLSTFTYERDEQITAWATHSIGGAEAFVETVAIVPSITDNEDEVWLGIKRTFNDVTTRSIEVISDFWHSSMSPEDAIFMDSSISFSSAERSVSAVVLLSSMGDPYSNVVRTSTQHECSVGDIVEWASDTDSSPFVGRTYEVAVVVDSFQVTLAEPGTGSHEITLEALPSVDSTIRKTVTRVVGALHLVGQTVGVLASGRVEAEAVVDAVGGVDLQSPSGRVTVGHQYEARLRTMSIDAGAENGTSQGKVGRTHSTVLRLVETGPGLYVGSDFDDDGIDATMDLVELRRFETLSFNQAIPLFTGDTDEVTLPSKYEQQKSIALRHGTPTNCKVIAVYPRMVTQDGG